MKKLYYRLTYLVSIELPDLVLNALYFLIR
jgi:hypothetical protein